MNLKLKALVLAAVATLAASGSAFATMSTATNANSDLLLTVFDSSNSSSVTFDLGLTYGNFSTATAQSWDLTSASNAAYSTAWTKYVAQDANYAANSLWAVTAVADTSNTNTRGFVSTIAATSSTTVLGSQVGTMAANFDTSFVAALAATGAFGGTNGAYYASSSDPANSGNAYSASGTIGSSSVTAADVFGNKMVVDKLLKTGTTLASAQPLYFNVTSAGVVNLAPVPEADTWAMMLAGFGVMGFIARRRKSNSLKFA